MHYDARLHAALAALVVVVNPDAAAINYIRCCVGMELRTDAAGGHASRGRRRLRRWAEIDVSSRAVGRSPEKRGRCSDARDA